VWVRKSVSAGIVKSLLKLNERHPVSPFSEAGARVLLQSGELCSPAREITLPWNGDL
jgi:hypothetical protein